MWYEHHTLPLLIADFELYVEQIKIKNWEWDYACVD